MAIYKKIMTWANTLVYVSLVSEHFLIKVKSKLPKIEIGIVKYMAGEILMVGIMSPLNCPNSVALLL